MHEGYVSTSIPASPMYIQGEDQSKRKSFCMQLARINMTMIQIRGILVLPSVQVVMACFMF
jgi:hypothetical protein